MLRKNVLVLGLLLLMASLVLWGCNEGVVATVNGEKITSQELEQRLEEAKNGMMQQGFQFDGEQGKQLEQMMRQDLVNQMISEKLILQEVEKRKLQPGDGEVEAEIAKIKEQLGSEADFKKFLAANNINEVKVKDLIKEQMAAMKLQELIVADIAKPTAAEIEKYFNENKEQFATPEQRQVRHILVGTGEYSSGANRSDVDAKVLALQLIDKLNTGEDFGKLVEEHSDDPGSKENGGQYPPFSHGSGFAQEFEAAAFSLTEGSLTKEPVKTQFGYHIIRLDDIIAAKTSSLEEVKDVIESNLHNTAANEAFMEFLQQLRDKADIVNHLEEKADVKNNQNNNGQENANTDANNDEQNKPADKK